MLLKSPVEYLVGVIDSISLLGHKSVDHQNGVDKNRLSPNRASCCLRFEYLPFQRIEMVEISPLSHILPEWPSWAVNLLLTMTAALTCTLLAAHYLMPTDDDEEKKVNKMENPQSALKSSDNKSLHADFDKFKHSYLSVYLVIMLADWMQGTHMYTLYLSYNVNISALFLTGFLSGAIFAPFLGSLVDKFGRKRSCLVYCVLEIIINWLEHYSDFRTLLLGRILGGISTNLLFSAFESWMATEHRKRGFPEEWMAKTYSAVSLWKQYISLFDRENLFILLSCSCWCFLNNLILSRIYKPKQYHHSAQSGMVPRPSLLEYSHKSSRIH